MPGGYCEINNKAERECYTCFIPTLFFFLLLPVSVAEMVVKTKDNNLLPYSSYVGITNCIVQYITLVAGSFFWQWPVVFKISPLHFGEMEQTRRSH